VIAGEKEMAEHLAEGGIPFPSFASSHFVAPAASPDSEYELRHAPLYSRSSSSKPEYLVRRGKECSIKQSVAAAPSTPASSQASRKSSLKR
jgi:hypothetical protein